MEEHKGLLAAGRRAWESLEYSDLIIQCGSHDFKVHRFVVCLQSDFFANAIKDGLFKEGQIGIIKMDEEDPIIIGEMLKFLYTFEYSVINQNSQEETHPLLFHVNMYAIADRIQNESLKSLAEEKFNEVAETAWNDPEFLSAIQAVYKVTPPGTKGDRLRGFAAKVAAQHARVLFEKGKEFDAVMEGIADFGRDLAQALSVIADSNTDTVTCPKSLCGCVFRVIFEESELGHLRPLFCPACGKKIPVLAPFV